MLKKKNIQQMMQMNIIILLNQDKTLKTITKKFKNVSVIFVEQEMDTLH